MTEDFFKQKKPWSKYKDFILDYYLTPYIAKVKMLRRPILLIDCCAGPGKFDDGHNGSPVISARHIVEGQQKGINIKGLFLEKKRKYFKTLEDLMKPHSPYIVVQQTDFTDYLNKIAEMALSHTVFLYVDPYGIKELPFEKLANIYEQINKSGASVEVLMNFNSAGFIRCGLAALRMELKATDLQPSEDFYDEPIAEIQGTTLQQMNEIAGGDYWVEIVADSNLSFAEKEHKITVSYMKQMRKYYSLVCNFPIKEKYHHLIPKYRLLYGTRHDDGILLMNDTIYKARELFLNSEFADDRLFDTRPLAEQKDPTNFAIRLFEIIGEKGPISRKKVKMIAMREYFCHYNSGDYSSAITSLLKGFNGVRIYSKSGKTRINDEEVLSIKPFKSNANYN